MWLNERDKMGTEIKTGTADSYEFALGILVTFSEKTEKEIIELVQAKRESLNNLVSLEGAVHIVAKDLRIVDFNKKIGIKREELELKKTEEVKEESEKRKEEESKENVMVKTFEELGIKRTSYEISEDFKLACILAQKATDSLDENSYKTKVREFLKWNRELKLEEEKNERQSATN